MVVRLPGNYLKKTNDMETVKHEEQLQKLFANVNEWLKFAEAKNFGLLSLNGAVMFGFLESNLLENNTILVGFYVFASFILFSFLVTLLSLFPIVSTIEKGQYAKSWIDKFCNWIDKEKQFENIHFYGYLKRIDESSFETNFLNKIGSIDPFSQYERELVSQILYNSRITWLKYQLFKMGAFFFLLGLILFAISLILCKIIV